MRALFFYEAGTSEAFSSGHALLGRDDHGKKQCEAVEKLADVREGGRGGLNPRSGIGRGPPEAGISLA
jgi:hypothetical protein